MGAAIYGRYSSDKQTEDSIEAQVRACAEYAAAKGLKIVKQYVDEAISGKEAKTNSRKHYQEMLRDCEKGLFDVILVHKYDRVARSLSEHVALEKKLSDKGILLIATAQDFGSSSEAKIMRTLMWALSEYYIDNLSGEVKKGHRETAIKGLHNGGYAPFGYDVVEQEYVINALESAYVRKIFDAAANRQGYTEIIQEMDAAGIRGKRGKPIRYTQIYEMLRNEKYTGVYTYSPQEDSRRGDRRQKPNAIRIENALPVIISKAQFKEVQQIMDGRKQTGKKAGYLCSGLVYCECGAKMHGLTSRRKGHEYQYFYCSKKCGAPVARMGEVDNRAIRYLHELLSPSNQAKIAAALRIYQDGEKGHMEDFNKALRAKATDKQRQYDALMDNLSSSALPPEVVEDIGRKMKALKEEMQALQETLPPHDFTVDQITAWLEALKAAPDEKAIHLLIEKINIKNKTDISIFSTLTSVLGEIGCGSTQHALPKILFAYFANL